MIAMLLLAVLTAGHTEAPKPTKKPTPAMACPKGMHLVHGKPDWYACVPNVYTPSNQKRDDYEEGYDDGQEDK